MRDALACAVASFDKGRREFSAQDLAAAQLVNVMGGPSVKNAAFKRQVFCGLLGAGACNGKKLLRVLNRFVSRQRYEDLLASTEQELQRLGVDVGGEQDVGGQQAADAADEDEIAAE